MSPQEYDAYEIPPRPVVLVATAIVWCIVGVVSAFQIFTRRRSD